MGFSTTSGYEVLDLMGKLLELMGAPSLETMQKLMNFWIKIGSMAGKYLSKSG